MAVSNWFTQIIQRIEALGVSTELTLFQLTLGTQNVTTGWYNKTYDESSINMVLIPSSAQDLLLKVGTVCRKDAVAYSATRLTEGDVIKNFFGYHYTITTMRLHPVGNQIVAYEYDLTYLPYFITPEIIMPPLGPWGFEVPLFEIAIFEHGEI